MFWTILTNILNVFSSFFYLIGSVCFLPQVNLVDFGMNHFVIGSLMTMAAQIWKFYRKFR
jgi:hypothetical protein